MRRLSSRRPLLPVALTGLLVLLCVGIAQAVAPAPTCTAPVVVTMHPGALRSFDLGCAALPDPDWGYAVIDAQPGKGSLDWDSEQDGLASYRAGRDASGEDSFSWHVEGPGGRSQTVTQQITLDPEPNAAPSCQAQEVSLRTGRSVAIGAFCPDPDGDPATVRL